MTPELERCSFVRRVRLCYESRVAMRGLLRRRDLLAVAVTCAAAVSLAAAAYVAVEVSRLSRRLEDAEARAMAANVVMRSDRDAITIRNFNTLRVTNVAFVADFFGSAPDVLTEHDEHVGVVFPIGTLGPCRQVVIERNHLGVFRGNIHYERLLSFKDVHGNRWSIVDGQPQRRAYVPRWAGITPAHTRVRPEPLRDELRTLNICQRAE
jgi:hypothetical protein